MDQRTLRLLEESPAKFLGYDLARRVGATEAQLRLLKLFAEADLPPDYLDFLSYTNGFGDDLWGIEEILEDAYNVKRFMPGAIPIGNNGGPDVYILDLRPGDPNLTRYLQIDVCGLTWAESTARTGAVLKSWHAEWPTFHSFFAHFYEQWGQE